MADIGILGIQKVSLSAPGKLIIGTTDRETIIANPDNPLAFINNTGPNLGAGILGAFGRKLGNGHKILFPANIISPFIRHNEKV